MFNIQATKPVWPKERLSCRISKFVTFGAYSLFMLRTPKIFKEQKSAFILIKQNSEYLFLSVIN